MAPAAMTAKCTELRKELNTERGLVARGGRSSNPGRIREIRRTIARLLTFMSQNEEYRTDKENKAKTAAQRAAPASKPAPDARAAKA